MNKICDLPCIGPIHSETLFSAKRALRTYLPLSQIGHLSPQFRAEIALALAILFKSDILIFIIDNIKMNHVNLN